MCSCTVVCVQGVQEWAEDTALRCTSVGIRGDDVLLPILTTDFCLSGSPGSSCTEICSVLESGASQPVWQHYGVKCRTIIHEQHPHIGVLIFQVGESSVQGEGNSIVCGTVYCGNANCSGSSEAGRTEQMCSLTSFSKHLLKMGVSSNGALQSFKHVILFLFGMGTMMDFLKHEGTTD